MPKKEKRFIYLTVRLFRNQANTHRARCSVRGCSWTGTATTAGYKLNYNLSAETDGADKCPPASGRTSLKRAWDDGDATAPRRSCARADAWAEAHKRGGYVLKNYGYKGQGHSSSCKVSECKPDYECMMAVLDGKPPPAGCK